MANEKKSFIFRHEYRELFDDLTAEEVGMILLAVMDYEIDGVEPSFDDRSLRMAFREIKRDLDSNREKYAERCESNSQNGKKGGRPKKNQTVSEKTEKSERFSEKAKKADNDNEYEYDNDIDITTTTSSSNKESVGSCCDESFGKVFSAVEKEFGRPISPIESERIKEWVENHNEDLVLHALKTAIIHDKRSFSYIGGILKNWKDNDIRSVYEAEAAGERFKTTKNNKKVGGASHSGVNFDEVYAI